eukprot:9485435-Pyramimonas_sp.AAC.1
MSACDCETESRTSAPAEDTEGETADVVVLDVGAVELPADSDADDVDPAADEDEALRSEADAGTWAPGSPLGRSSARSHALVGDAPASPLPAALAAAAAAAAAELATAEVAAALAARMRSTSCAILASAS